MNARKIAICLLLLFCFTIGFSAGTGIKFYYESTTFKPFVWNHEPTIINCYGKDFNKFQFERAIEYWAIRGYKAGLYIHNPPISVCDNYWLEGMIILRKNENLSHDTLANTRRRTSAFTMRSAIIQYSPGSQNLNLLNEHELGHALGFTHIEKEGHIMHPHYRKMGRNFYIP